MGCPIDHGGDDGDTAGNLTRRAAEGLLWLLPRL